MKFISIFTKVISLKLLCVAYLEVTFFQPLNANRTSIFLTFSWENTWSSGQYVVC